MTHLGILIIILSLMYISYGHYHGAYSHDSDIGGGNDDWMAHLSDSVLISQVSLPGTHDTIADDNDGDAADCQSLSLSKQLAAGIRALDIRCRRINNAFAIHHGMYYLSQNFDDVLRDCTSFLNAHPREFIVMRVKEEYDAANSHDSFDTIFGRYRNNPSYSSYFYQPANANSMPNIGEVRGKIVVLQGFAGGNYGLGYPSGHYEQDMYALGSNWDLYNKWERVKEKILHANNDQSTSKFYINYLSGSTGSFPYFVASGHSSPGTSASRLSTGRTIGVWGNSWPDFPRVNCAWNPFIWGTDCTIAFEGTNILTYDFIHNYGIEFVGIVMVDFPGKSLIDRIIGLNDHMVGAGTLRPQDITKCLDVNAGAGDNVYVHPCHFGTNQKWSRGVPDADGFYTLVSQYNNECLDAHPEGDGIVNSGDNIYVYPCHYGDNQKWKIDGVIIRNKANGRNGCLDVGDHNGNVHIWSCDSNNGNQRVKFIEQTIIRSTYHNKCLDVNYGSGDNVYLHSCHGGTNQAWRRGTPDSAGYYQLISEYNNECMDAHPEGDGIVNAGDNIYTHPCHGGDNQKWKIDGELIKSKSNGGNKCIDGGDSGNNAHIWDCSTSNSNQLFKYPGFSSAWSIGNMIQMDDFQFMDAEKPIESEKNLYILEAVGVLLLINIICFVIYFCKRNNNTSKKGYKVVHFDSEATDLENPDK